MANFVVANCDGVFIGKWQATLNASSQSKLKINVFYN